MIHSVQVTLLSWIASIAMMQFQGGMQNHLAKICRKINHGYSQDVTLTYMAAANVTVKYSPIFQLCNFHSIIHYCNEHIYSTILYFHLPWTTQWVWDLCHSVSSEIQDDYYQQHIRFLQDLAIAQEQCMLCSILSICWTNRGYYMCRHKCIISMMNVCYV